MADRDDHRPVTAGRTSRRRSATRVAVIAVVAVAVLLVPFAVLTIFRWSGDEDAPGSDPPGREEPTPAPQPAPDVVTEDRDGATLILRTGRTVALRLSSEWLWEEPQVTGAAIALTRVDHSADPGYAEWQVEAATPGTSEVTVAGSPNCPDEAACPPRRTSFRFDVEG